MPILTDNRNKWTKEQLIELYRMKHDESRTSKEIAQKLGKSEHNIDIKYRRVDWDKFSEDPDGYLVGKGSARKWQQVEMAQLSAFLQSGKSYAYIAEQLNRSYISVERKAQTTNWQAWKLAVGDPTVQKDEEVEDKDVLKEQLATALVLLSRQQQERLDSITEEEFQRKINFGNDMPFSFSDIKKAAVEQLAGLGLGNPASVKYGEGTYIVVGDSHGKFTRTNMFTLLKEVVSFIKPDKVIHIGHLLDDDNDISYHWGEFKNLVVLSKTEELKLVQEQRNKFNFNYEVVREEIQIGDSLLVMNQDIISDYVKTSLSTLDSEIFYSRTIVNCHRLEWTPKCSDAEEVQSYIVAPGCLCEKHVVRTIKQIDFEDGRTVKQSFPTGYNKYRRMGHMHNYWTQGILVIHVDKQGNHTIVPCLIRNINDNYMTSYFDKIITSNGVRNPTKKIFVTGDAHAPSHDGEALDIQEQVCKDYKPDVLVNLGDAHDYRSLNHHELDRGRPSKGNILAESAQVHFMLKRMATWAKEKHIIDGNHERFALDFIAKNPQLEDYLEFGFICDLENLVYKVTPLKEVLKIGSVKFIHGDLTMYGQTGNKTEKASRTFGDCVFLGHVHYPAIRFGSYSIGLSGQLDQIYNEPAASTWIHGFGLCNQYDGFSWPTTLAISNGRCIINGKKYAPKDASSWVAKKFKARLTYSF